MRKKGIFPNKLKYYREKAGYTLEEVGAVLDYTEQFSYKGIPNRLKYFREKKGYTLEDIAELLDLDSIEPIIKWEKSEEFPDLKQMFALEYFYDTTLAEIYKEMCARMARDIDEAKKVLNIK